MIVEEVIWPGIVPVEGVPILYLFAICLCTEWGITKGWTTSSGTLPVPIKPAITSQEDFETYSKTSRIGRTTRLGRQDKVKIWSLVEEYKIRKKSNYSKYELCNILKEYFDRNNYRPFSHLICDEVQDFSNIELSLMRSLVEEKENDLFFVGDPFQNIYCRKINFSKSGISVRGKRSKKLKVNYRTTEEIKHFALKTLWQEKYDDFDGGEENTKGYISLIHGNDPVYKVFSTPEEEENFIVGTVKELLKEKFETTNYESAKEDVTNFVNDKDGLKLWKKELFISTIDSLKS